MSRDEDGRKKRKINEDDNLNRTFYGSPTIGGVLVIIAIVLYFIFR